MTLILTVLVTGRHRKVVRSFMTSVSFYKRYFSNAFIDFTGKGGGEGG